MIKFPEVIRIEPASLCNFKCIHCPTGTVNMHRGMMSNLIFDKIKKELEIYKDKIRVLVLYHGGEPLLNNNFFSFLEKLKLFEKTFIKTVSNGSLLNDEIINLLLNSRLNSIEISLDGKSDIDNNKVRRNCDYKKIVCNIKKLIAEKKKNKSKLDIIVTTTQFISNVKDISTTPKIPENLLLDFKEEYQNKDLVFKSNWAIRWPDMNLIDGIYEYEDIQIKKNDNFCDHIINTITIRWNGDIVPCCYDLTSKVVLGNIQNNSLNDIWNGDGYNKLRNDIAKRKFNELCGSCALMMPTKYLMIKKTSEDFYK